MNVMEFLIKLQCPDANGITQTMYRCDLCKKVSKDRSNMKRHMILIHAAPSNLPCPYRCGNVFKNKIYLATHVNSKICLRNQKFSAYWMSFRWLPIRSHRFFLILNLSKLNFLSCQNSKWMKNQSWFPYTINKVPICSIINCHFPSNSRFLFFLKHFFWIFLWRKHTGEFFISISASYWTYLCTIYVTI